MLVWLVLAAGSPAADLNHPDFRTRERAQARLEASWPLSRPALKAAFASPDPEARRRALDADRRGAARLFGPRGHVARGILDRPRAADRLSWLMGVHPGLVCWPAVDFALADPRGDRLTALWLATASFPPAAASPGLPWLPAELHAGYARDRRVAKALCDLANHLFAAPDGGRILLGCDPSLKFRPAGAFLWGCDDVRFWVRRLPGPTGNRSLAESAGRWAESPLNDRDFATPPPPPRTPPEEGP